MSWLSVIVIILSFTFNNVSHSEAKHQNKKLPSAVVVGTVYCDTCFHQDFSKSSHFISGASVAIECGDARKSRPSFREEVKTHENGKFKVHLPFSVSKRVKKIMGCSVKLISSNEPYCAVASTATSSSIRLKSKKAGTHIFSAGFFTFKPLKQPELCNQKPNIKNSMESVFQNPNDLSFPPSLQDPPMPFLPPLDEGILPTIPHRPRVPGIPIQSSDEKAMAIPIFPPNPFMPPSLFPPNPFLPPPSILPPIFPSPPPSLFPPINFPPLPGLIPSPSPPPPAFPIPLPPFPFQPTPGFPGIPPASSSPSSKKTSP